MKILITLEDGKLNEFQLKKLIENIKEFTTNITQGDYPITINKELPSYELLDDSYDEIRIG